MVKYYLLNNKKKAFTLVEVLVATALFVTVLTIATVSLTSVVFVNRKAQAMHISINNLHSTIDSMVRSVRMGTNYHCGNIGYLDLPRDCLDGGELFAFREYGQPEGSYRVYYTKEVTTSSGTKYNALFRKRVDKYGNVLEEVQISSPDINIEKFKVYVRGSHPDDNQQAFATFVIQGSVGKSYTDDRSLFGKERKVQTEFLIQSASTQRLLDI